MECAGRSRTSVPPPFGEDPPPQKVAKEVTLEKAKDGILLYCFVFIMHFNHFAVNKVAQVRVANKSGSVSYTHLTLPTIYSV